jgi:hypothetical protein
MKQEKSDGCSGLQSWLWKRFTRKGPPWEYCCDEHDVAYIEGGTLEWRKFHDLKLKECMEKAGYPTWANIYYWFVRAFGWIHWPT